MNFILRTTLAIISIYVVVKTYIENRIIPIKQGFQHRRYTLADIAHKLEYLNKPFMKFIHKNYRNITNNHTLMHEVSNYVEYGEENFPKRRIKIHL